MRYDTQTVDIAADPATVAAFIADGANLPRWAIGFAKQVTRSEDGDWSVTTGSGACVATRIHHDATAGTVDFVMSPTPNDEVTAWTRSVRVGTGTLLTFTQAQHRGMSDDAFDAQVAAVRHELVALKALLEVSCPL
jgi:hypothetical protein